MKRTHLTAIPEGMPWLMVVEALEAADVPFETWTIDESERLGAPTSKLSCDMFGAGELVHVISCPVSADRLAEMVVEQWDASPLSSAPLAVPEADAPDSLVACDAQTAWLAESWLAARGAVAKVWTADQVRRGLSPMPAEEARRTGGRRPAVIRSGLDAAQVRRAATAQEMESDPVGWAEASAVAVMARSQTGR